MSELDRELAALRGQPTRRDPTEEAVSWAVRQQTMRRDALRDIENAPVTKRFLAAMNAAGNPGTGTSLRRRSNALLGALLGEKSVRSWRLGRAAGPEPGGLYLTVDGPVTYGPRTWQDMDPEQFRRAPANSRSARAFHGFEFEQGTLAATLAAIMHSAGVEI